MSIFVAKAALALMLIPVTYVLYCGILYRHNRKSLKYLRGPPKTSFFMGAEYELMLQEEAYQLESKWFKEYGTAFRASTYFSEDLLMVADPGALQYILHTSGYRFPKPQDVTQSSRFLNGCGIINAEGEVHNRHRKALNPAFSAKQLRQFLELFQQSTAKLASKWQQQLDDATDGELVVNVCHWLPKTTLDIIGESAFNYKFGSLDGKETELGNIFENLFVDSRIHLPKLQLLYRSFRRDLPTPIADFLLNFPTKEEKRFLGFLTASKKIGKPILEKGTKEKIPEEEGKDILSILVRANQEVDEKKSMNEDEVLSQITTFLVAGHETTASATTWILYSLAKHPKIQARVYQEIQDLRELIGANEPTVQDLDSMPYLNAVIKETLRCFPIVPHITREAHSDDVIPLEFPVAGVSGDPVSRIPVSKGQRILIDIAVYNKLPQIWGEDAEEWRPERFLESFKMAATTVGVYSNLLTFSAGIRACIGWRFAVMELQALVFGLLEKFEFCPPPSGELDEIQAVSFALIMPMKRNRWREGKQMPLFVKARN
ncbi:hypothetical protein GYMLUDRAFT_41250 [Collybiopsis luxurians FD-317 M1]|uniref:Unplaced genomic scaffold GYMLUscaffold_17, whole genome shotgun sequence n=1 Tax=Collybiopsis luxurians FD-317 M1 TaxID=944289 RepID=A0A0D0C497_9AGAR|nr:hypothetical protein GYMLUDRAFT_41250 [Collybiopsis luxurians FD-317 M1]